MYGSDCVAAHQIKFKWGLAGGTSYDDCGSGTGDSGFAIPSAGTTSIKPTIHGDHWFFSGIPHGSVEITNRLALFDPQDPVRFDYALCRIGILGICQPELRKSRCAACLAADACPAGIRRVGRAQGALPLAS